MTPQIFLAGPSDLAQIVRLLGAQYDEHDIALSGERLAHAVSGMLSDPSRGEILLARIDDREGAVGIAVFAYTWTLEHGGLSSWLDELYVDPDLRSSGLGRALLLRGIEHVKGRGAAAIDLEVVAGHERAARLYEREGFVRRDRVRWMRPL